MAYNLQLFLPEEDRVGLKHVERTLKQNKEHTNFVYLGLSFPLLMVEAHCKGKGKGKGRPRTDHEGPEGE
jgi:hypothetical protein